MKNKLFAFLLLTCSVYSSIYGNLCNFNIEPYVGITGGVSSLAGKYSASSPLVPNSTIKETRYTRFGHTGALLGGVLGVQTCFNDDIYIALQGNALYHYEDSRVFSTTNALGVKNHRVAIRNDFQWGIDARLGWCLCGVSPYLLGGFESGKWRMTLRNNTSISNLGIPPFTTLHPNKTLYGPKIGFGTIFPISCHLFTNLEYSYTWFGTITRSLRDTVTTRVWRHRQKIYQHSILVGLNYAF